MVTPEQEILTRVRVGVYRTLACRIPETSVGKIHVAIEDSELGVFPPEIVVRYEFGPGAVIVSRQLWAPLMKRSRQEGWPALSQELAAEIMQGLVEEAERRGL